MVECLPNKGSTALSALDIIRAEMGLKNDSELARYLKVSPQAVSKARKTGKIPPNWLKRIADSTGKDIQALLRMAPSPSDNAECHPSSLVPNRNHLSAICTCCVDLEAKIKELEEELRGERQERRELSAENRQLWKENGQLRERVARLEEAAHKPGILSENAAHTGTA